VVRNGQLGAASEAGYACIILFKTGKIVVERLNIGWREKHNYIVEYIFQIAQIGTYCAIDDALGKIVIISGKKVWQTGLADIAARKQKFFFFVIFEKGKKVFFGAFCGKHFPFPGNYIFLNVVGNTLINGEILRFCRHFHFHFLSHLKEVIDRISGIENDGGILLKINFLLANFPCR
jgi:hypothetical protein